MAAFPYPKRPQPSDFVLIRMYKCKMSVAALMFGPGFKVGKSCDEAKPARVKGYSHKVPLPSFPGPRHSGSLSQAYIMQFGDNSDLPPQSS